MVPLRLAKKPGRHGRHGSPPFGPVALPAAHARHASSWSGWLPSRPAGHVSQNVRVGFDDRPGAQDVHTTAPVAE